MVGAFFGPPNRFGDPARRGDVILLYQDAVEERVAMIRAAAMNNRLLFKPPHQGGRLTGAANPAIQAASCATKAAVKVAMPDKCWIKFMEIRSAVSTGRVRALELDQNVAALEMGAVLHRLPILHLRLHDFIGNMKRFNAAEHAILLGQQAH